jgi:serine/threonine protein kinase
VLADYGLVFVIETTDFTSTKTAGTCRWMAPEVMNPADELLEDQDPPVLFTMKSDIYAFGMTAFEASPNSLSTIWISESLFLSDPVRECPFQQQEDGQLCDLLRARWQSARLP